MSGERSDVDVEKQEMTHEAGKKWINDYSTTETNNEGKWQRDSVIHGDDYSGFKFLKANPFLDHTNPFKEGLQRLEVHDIVNAVLFFEAAVQKQSDHIEVVIKLWLIAIIEFYLASC
jgi:hypothetical protein